MKKVLIMGLMCILSSSSCTDNKKNLEVAAMSSERNKLVQDVQQNSASPQTPEPPNVEITKFTPPKIVQDEEGKPINKESLAKITVQQQKKIIKNGNLSIKSKDIQASKKNFDALLKKYSAYYENEEFLNEENQESVNLKIRIPTNHFEIFISNLDSGKDEIMSKSIQAQDITEEYIDIEARLKNKRNYLNRYTELLSKATTIKDMLAIEENIRTLQEEIESKEGRLKYLNDQVNYSTLAINIFKTKEFVYKPDQQDNFLERVKKSMSSGWNSIVDFSIFLLKIWPLYILAIIVFSLIRLYKSKK